MLVPSPEESNVGDGLRTRTLSLDGFPAPSHSYLNDRGRGGRGVRGRMVVIAPRAGGTGGARDGVQQPVDEIGRASCRERV